MIFLLLISVGYSQLKLELVEYRPFPDEVEILDLEPTKISWSMGNKFLLLDQNKGELF